MHAAFCVGRTRKIPAMMADTPDSDVRAQVIGMIERCPSGSYLYALTPIGEVDPALAPAGRQLGEAFLCGQRQPDGLELVLVHRQRIVEEHRVPDVERKPPLSRWETAP
jgi:hypothetical protein